MDYSIKPEEKDVREARRKVEEVLESYSFAFDVEKVEIELGWQEIDRDTSMVSAEGSRVVLVIDPEADLEGLEESVLLGILEIEFLEKAVYEEISFNWQEVAKFAYVRARFNELLGEEADDRPDLKEKWRRLRGKMSEVTEFDEEFYMNAAGLGELIGQELLKDHDVEEFPEMKRSEFVEAGDILFS